MAGLAERSVASNRPNGRNVASGVEAGAHFLAGLEIWDALARDLDGLSGAGIATFSGVALTRGKRAETAQLDPAASGQARGNLVEEHIDQALDILGAKLRILLGERLQ
jgi:hypothetical protein